MEAALLSCLVLFELHSFVYKYLIVGWLHQKVNFSDKKNIKMAEQNIDCTFLFLFFLITSCYVCDIAVTCPILLHLKQRRYLGKKKKNNKKT